MKDLGVDVEEQIKRLKAPRTDLLVLVKLLFSIRHIPMAAAYYSVTSSILPSFGQHTVHRKALYYKQLAITVWDMYFILFTAQNSVHVGCEAVILGFQFEHVR